MAVHSQKKISNAEKLLHLEQAVRGTYVALLQRPSRGYQELVFNMNKQLNTSKSDIIDLAWHFESESGIS